MSEDGEMIMRQRRSALLLVLVFGRDFGGLFAEVGYGKNMYVCRLCIMQITDNQESPKSERGCFVGNAHVGVKPKQKITNCS